MAIPHGSGVPRGVAVCPYEDHGVPTRITSRSGSAGSHPSSQSRCCVGLTFGGENTEIWVFNHFAMLRAGGGPSRTLFPPPPQVLGLRGEGSSSTNTANHSALRCQRLPGDGHPPPHRHPRLGLSPKCPSKDKGPKAVLLPPAPPAPLRCCGRAETAKRSEPEGLRAARKCVGGVWGGGGNDRGCVRTNNSEVTKQRGGE